MKRSIFISVALFIGALGLTGCVDEGTDDDICDAYEATDYSYDCGYWGYDATGAEVFVWYSWVTPYVGGTPSNGAKPTIPAGTKTAPPPKVKPALPPGVKPPAPPKAPPKPPPAPKPPVKGK